MIKYLIIPQYQNTTDADHAIIIDLFLLLLWQIVIIKMSDRALNF